MKKIGLVDVDRKGKYPNLALMKISAYHKSVGDIVEWADPMFGEYDIVYKSKIFIFSEDDRRIYNTKQVVVGGTGYDASVVLPKEIDRMRPDYSIYPYVSDKTAYGFLTRGCPNKCKWCIVPIKEGSIQPYMDVEDIAVDGRSDLNLMDNNILAAGDYAVRQFEKIIDNRFRADFNQGLDARLVDDRFAKLLANMRWLFKIRFGCDTPKQVCEVERAMELIDSYSAKPKWYFLYTIITNDMQESYERISHFRAHRRVLVQAQPWRDLKNARQVIPQWQKDMARWADRKEIYSTCDFKDYIPRKNFICNQYFK